MLCAVLNKSWKQRLPKQQLCSHLPPISQSIQVRWTRHAGHHWRSKDKLISDVLLWTPTHAHISVDQPAKTCIHQLYVNTGCSQEDLPGIMDDRDRWQERVRELHAVSTTWWWWWHPLQILIKCWLFSKPKIPGLNYFKGNILQSK